MDGTVLVTGATGFIGRPLCAHLAQMGRQVRAAVRSAGASVAAETAIVGEIDGETDWRAALRGVSAVVHLASRVHVMDDPSADPLAEYRRTNVEGTRNLARQCIACGVRRIVFASSIKVNGDGRDRPYTEQDPPAPADPYGQSKLEAEQALMELCKAEKTAFTIVRPTVVYGPGVKGNILRLLRLADQALPLPLRSVRNQRSMVGVGNLCSFVAACLDSEAAANQVFLLSDGEDLSTAELVRRLAAHLGRPARLLPCPVWLLKWLGVVTGKSDEVRRLVGSLQVDISKARRLLGWRPPFTVDQQLAEMVQWYRSQRESRLRCTP